MGKNFIIRGSKKLIDALQGEEPPKTICRVVPSTYDSMGNVRLNSRPYMYYPWRGFVPLGNVRITESSIDILKHFLSKLPPDALNEHIYISAIDSNGRRDAQIDSKTFELSAGEWIGEIKTVHTYSHNLVIGRGDYHTAYVDKHGCLRLLETYLDSPKISTSFLDSSISVASITNGGANHKYVEVQVRRNGNINDNPMMKKHRWSLIMDRYKARRRVNKKPICSWIIRIRIRTKRRRSDWVYYTLKQRAGGVLDFYAKMS